MIKKYKELLMRFGFKEFKNHIIKLGKEKKLKAFMMYYFDDMKLREIAAIEGVTKECIRQRIAWASRVFISRRHHIIRRKIGAEFYAGKEILPICDLLDDLDVRTYQALEKAGIKYIIQLKGKSRQEIIKIKGIGKNCLSMLEKALGKREIYLYND